MSQNLQVSSGILYYIRVYLWFVRYLFEKVRFLMVFLLFIGVLRSVISPIQIYLMGATIDQVVAFYNGEGVFTLLDTSLPKALLFLVLIGILQLLSLLMGRMFSFITTKIDLKLRSGTVVTDVVEKFYRLNLYDLERSDIFTKLDIFSRYWFDNVILLLRQSVNFLSRVISFLVTLTLFSTSSSGPVSFFVFLIVIGVLFSALSEVRLRAFEYRLDVALSLPRRFIDYFQSVVLNTSTFLEQKVNRVYRFLMQKLKQVASSYEQTSVNVYKRLNTFYSLSDAVRVYTYVLSRVLYLYNAIVSKAPVGQITANLGLLGNIYDSLYMLVRLGVDIINSLFYVDELFEILSLRSTRFTNKGTFSIDTTKPPLIEWKRLTYKVKSGREYRLVLKDVSWIIKPSEKVFIYGKDGVGKTFLVKILVTLFPVKRGTYFINGIDVVDIKRGEVKELFSVVTDNFEQLALPLCEAVTLQDFDKIDKDRYIRALKIADLYEWALSTNLLWNRYTPLGMVFSNLPLSVGYWQRIAIARAVYRDAPIFLFDMPFTYIDDEGKSKIMKNLLNYVTRKRKTFIYITEEFDFWENFDVWYVKTPTKLKKLTKQEVKRLYERALANR